MRRGLLVATLGIALLQALPSHANTLASCRQTAGPNGIPDNASVGGVCIAAIDIAATTDVVVRLTPSAAFTGVLTAKVTSTEYGVAVRGVYVAGQLVNGMDEETITLTAAPDAEWRLTVTAGEASPTSTYLFPPLPQQVTVPAIAFGEFGAEVVAAAEGPAEA
ncbi:MAG TPA: hypothetical protein VGB64_05845 [Actinomycetota bacterium]